MFELLLASQQIPDHLARRITLNWAGRLLQEVTGGFAFCPGKSSLYRQIKTSVESAQTVKSRLAVVWHLRDRRYSKESRAFYQAFLRSGSRRDLNALATELLFNELRYQMKLLGFYGPGSKHLR